MFKLIIVTILMTPNGEFVPYTVTYPFNKIEQCKRAEVMLKVAAPGPFLSLCAPVKQKL